MERDQLNHKIRFVLIALTLVVYILAGAASIAGITIYLALLCIASVIGIMDMTTRRSYPMEKYEAKLRNKCVLLLIFIVLSFMVNFIPVSISFNRVLLISCCMGFMFLCGNTLYNSKEIEMLCWVVIITTTISALVVIGQGLNIDSAYRFAELFGAGSESEVLSVSLKSERYYGLAKSALYFGYQASAAMALLMFLPQKDSTIRNRSVRFIIFLILIISLLFNRTRSAQVSVALILILKFLLSWNRSFTRQGVIRFIIIIPIVLLCGHYIVHQVSVEELASALRINELDHAGTTARLPMFLTALNYGLHHPFGMGVYHASPEYVLGIKNPREVSYVLNNACHNLIANCVGNHGIFSGMLLISLYYIVLHKCYQLQKIGTGVSKEFVIGIGVTVIVLLINGAMHNLYIFSGDLLSWFVFGVIIALNRKKMAGYEVDL